MARAQKERLLLNFFTQCLAQHGKRFRVVVADARPDGEGRATLRALLRAGIACTYVLLNAVPLVLQARCRLGSFCCYSVLHCWHAQCQAATASSYAAPGAVGSKRMGFYLLVLMFG